MISNDPACRRSRVARVDEPTIQTHGQRRAGVRQFVQVQLAGIDEAEPFLSEFAFDSIRSQVNVPPDRSGADHSAEWEHFGQDTHGQAIRHQPCKLVLQIHQLRGCALRQDLGKGAHRFGARRRTAALVISRALQAELAERSPENEIVLAFPAAAGAARRAVALFFREAGGLLGNDRLLQPAQQFPRFGQRQADILRAQLAALESPDLFHDARGCRRCLR